MSEKPDFLKNESEKQAEMAEQMLYEKYGEEFVVESLGGRWGTATDYFYTCNVHPANNEELSFQATVSKDYTKLEDEYATIMSQKSAEKLLYDNCLSVIDDTATIAVFSRKRTIDCDKDNMTLDSLIENNLVKISIYVLVDEEVDRNEVVSCIYNMFAEYQCQCTVYIHVYTATDILKRSFEEWKSTNYIYDDELDKLLRYSDEILVKIDGGKVSKVSE